MLSDFIGLCCVHLYAGVTGKCATCYEIDKIRKSNGERIIQEMCKQAHAIHRGGMFMPERMRYIYGVAVPTERCMLMYCFMLS